MARSMNDITLVGNVGNKPEGRAVGTKRVVNFSLATSESWKDKDGQWQEKTQWHRITVWSPLAETIEKSVGKGNRVLVRGKLTYNKWTNKDNVEVTTAQIEVRDFINFTPAPKDPNAPPPNESFDVPPSALTPADDDLPF